ncbi:histidinol dehydrogenase [Marinococcus halotolerans]|uniref:histidinol dehydrogenase n=1 Tax=Marinococcus halotolerans TaxID=301092 RepID=UPI000489A7D7|nr:histidinol dehydrogenase [Marinococcus halotolerans]
MNVTPLDKSVTLERTIEGGTEKQRESVASIIEKVRENGDKGLIELTEIFDRVTLDEMFVQQEEIDEAYNQVNDKELEAIRKAIENIRDFHQRQLRQSWMVTKEDGTMLGQRIIPFDRVGIYVPGGKAAYPSTIMMDAIPAIAAGVKSITMCSPPGEDQRLHPMVLVTASELGIKNIVKIGGAQAVAALAYGTESIQKVDKIVGPGNIYVALAKREVFGQVAIDSIAGPSEIVVLADETARADYIAADMLSQAEHDELASAVLVTTSEELGKEVAEELERQLEDLPRKKIAKESLDKHGAIYLTETMAEAVEAVNRLAPEHLEIMTAQPDNLLGSIRHAGAVFLGPYSAEAVGDYFAGPNHVLPTSGTARFSSPLGVDDFVKRSSVISYSKEALEENGEYISAIARIEGLEAHARAVDIRKGEK